jgi:hypothetical protein
MQWIQDSKALCAADNENDYNEERDAEEEFQFKRIPIAGENDGDSEESWEKTSWDSEEDGENGQDSLTNNCLTIIPRIPPSRTIHSMATSDIAFWVGPRKDGIVKIDVTHPFTLTPNYYQVLEDDEPLDNPVPLNSAHIPAKEPVSSPAPTHFAVLSNAASYPLSSMQLALIHPGQNSTKRSTVSIPINLTNSFPLKSATSKTLLQPQQYHNTPEPPEGRLSICV